MSNISHAVRSLLLVDDDKVFAKVFQKEAKKAGIELQTAFSLAQTKEIGSFKHFDAILVDYDLDDATGFEVVEFLNVLSVNRPVIMVSSTNRPNQDKLVTLPNIVGFVSKWMRPDEVLTCVMQVLNSQTPKEPASSANSLEA